MPKSTRATKISDNNKAWNRKKANKTPYQIESIAQKKSFLIICEGKNTEPEYFKSFPVVTATIETIGKGASKTALVRKAMEEARKTKYKGYEVWCVFDLDIKYDDATIKNDFDTAIDLAKQKGFQVAYSNDAFELWFVLHYKMIDTQLTRHQYYEMLREEWGFNYEKEGKEIAICKKNYKRLQNFPASQEKAILRAEKLHRQFKDEKYCEQNPCTTVYALVRALNECI